MIKDLILDILFPKRCPGCLKLTNDDSNFCNSCLNKIEIFNHLFCACCGARLYQFKKICHLNEQFIWGAATQYAQPIQNALHLLKFQFVERASKPLTYLLIKYFENLLVYHPLNLKKFIVVPVPISQKRLKIRGFNQSELIAQIFANYFKLNLTNNALIRIKHSKPQSEIKSFEERRLNVSDCFALKNNKEIENKNIILIDDVITSGSTVREAVKTLKSGNSKKIIVLAIARV